MSAFGEETERLVREFDAAVDAHLGWTRRVLRCAVLREYPGDDVLADDAHLRCRFGGWFSASTPTLAALDAVATAQALDQHRRMHAAVRSLCTALLAGEPGRAEDLDTYETSQARLVANLAHLKTQLLAHAARHDPLTGLRLRHGLEEEFDRHLTLAQRSGQQLVLMLADIDRFKLINDTHGHAVGDRALRHVAQMLLRGARAGEPVFRFGGEEFLLLMHVSGAAAAAGAADRMLQTLRETPHRLPGSAALELRASAGLSLAGAGERLEAVLARADRALYAAKQAGRDRWHWGGPG